MFQEMTYNFEPSFMILLTCIVFLMLDISIFDYMLQAKIFERLEIRKWTIRMTERNDDGK